MLKKFSAGLLAAAMIVSLLSSGETVSAASGSTESGDVPEVTLRVCNWEEYIDTGDWDEDELIDLDSGDIFGEQSVVEDFEDWYLETYGIKVKVEYSTFGTNEDLYNMLTLGDVYDVVCPSEYMFMKLIAEDKVVALSDEFFDTSNELNYYQRGLSPFIRSYYENSEVNGESWAKYAAGYMWGVTGFVYNPEEVTEEEASTWQLMSNPKFRRQVTVKDNVRDTYFAAVGSLKADLLTSEEFLSDPDYHNNLENEMNDVSTETIQAVQDYLQDCKDNFYSFETDSGKADMITGKVVANYQWSGDAGYTITQAREDDYTLCFAIPKESTNIYFDGWVMLKCGVEGDAMKQQAAEAWMNFMARPDIAVRNMYYIGYTSVISGGDDPTIFDYVKWNFEAEDDEEDVTEYNISYFFEDGEDSGDYTMTVPVDQTRRELYALYPTEDAISRTSIMRYFAGETNDEINQMWINVRCFNIHKVPVWVWAVLLVIIAAIAVVIVRSKRTKNY